MCLYPRTMKVYKANGTPVSLNIPCGKCIECSKQKANEWASRLMLEADCHKDVCCLTLTYDDMHLPAGEELCKRDIQLFLKSLRKAIAPVKVRYFYCGEYGSKNGRPHYHMIIFGWKPSDLVYKFSKKGHHYFNSKFTEAIWKRGWVVIDPALDKKTCFYCAKYLQKYADTDKAQKAFINMSLKPAIGSLNLKTETLKSGTYYQNGRKMSLCRNLRLSLARRGDIHPFDAQIMALDKAFRYKQKLYNRFPDPDEERKRRKYFEEMLGKPLTSQNKRCNISVNKLAKDSFCEIKRCSYGKFRCFSTR